MLPINFHDKFLFRIRFGYCNEPKVVFLALKFSKALEYNIKTHGSESGLVSGVMTLMGLPLLLGIIAAIGRFEDVEFVLMLL